MPPKTLLTPPKALGFPSLKKKTMSEMIGRVRAPRGFNLLWKTGRWHQLTLTSLSAPGAAIETNLYSVSLRGLFLTVIDQISKLPDPVKATAHFSITLIQGPLQPDMQKETIAVQEGTPITSYEPPATSLGPIDQELKL